jgi:hypothetical protein
MKSVDFIPFSKECPWMYADVWNKNLQKCEAIRLECNERNCAIYKAILALNNVYSTSEDAVA